MGTAASRLLDIGQVVGAVESSQNTKSFICSGAVAKDSNSSGGFCERDLLSGTGRDMLDHLTLLPQPAYLIVSSRLGDNHLWAEALNIGGYDVLANHLTARK